ncbi:helix-turn-helix transcriptional regulator [Corynebacterium uberis]|uniref:helix-turn-helix transcriptional regulator n=1 Tax=Corynebacterium TaxID=1716 RepID=UPI001D0BB3FB|nr:MULTISPECIES: WYL domain-containing protein [Corynebacterium]MCZ9308663.1 WYL domain-containing protein [Corynebacterium sp. c6VSa_13]UDL74303.1 WYL domain-containing protein [Corynebacterium uberis]UDL76864.1 WYL domain-containing protein [Corynebacterium uberis]UDL79077.1 WYL domain-containing protein [Corynebacterium uberis]UDL79315.1 WYL domain-containing protein [Corynebacterium uberis]
MSDATHANDLVRCLNLIPYFRSHPGVSTFEAAQDLGTTPQEILSDLRRLFCCGMPGLMPDDLVDLVFDYRSVEVINSQGLDHALRLTTPEAAALLMNLETLEAHPGLADTATVRSAAAKLRAATGTTTAAVFDSVPDAPPPSREAIDAAVRTALTHGTQLRLTYGSANSDTLSTRTVSPARIFSSGGHTYLVAFDHEVGDHRTFRTDRIVAARGVDKQAQPHAEDLDIDAADPFDFSADGAVAEVLIAPEAAWMSDYFPLVIAARPEEHSGHWLPATLTYASTGWLIRFALSHADRLTVTGPPEIVAAIEDRAGRALTAYDQV